ncbi:hypothetical protein ACETU7_27220 [Rhodococcus sp. 3Y1]
MTDDGSRKDLYRAHLRLQEQHSRQYRLRRTHEFHHLGRPAIRYTATVTNIPADNECDPPSAQFDVVTTPGYSTAEVMVFLVQSDQGLPDALNQGTIDQIIATIRKSETRATAHG